MQYILELSKETAEINKIDYEDSDNLDLPLMGRLLNSIVYEEIKRTSC